jgi:hypothetical protein
MIGIDATNGDISISAESSSSTSEWYKDIIFYLKSGKFPNGMSSKEKKGIKQINMWQLLKSCFT